MNTRKPLAVSGKYLKETEYQLFPSIDLYTSEFSPLVPFSRVGNAPNPFQIVTSENGSIPTIRNTGLTFSDVTDLISLKIFNKINNTNLPVVVNWSGGIDSTLVVGAIFKNFPKSYYENIKIQMNNWSYLENPVFFEKIIKPNFKIVSPDQGNIHTWKDSIIISGTPGDLIFIPFHYYIFLKMFPNTKNKSIINNPDILLYAIASKTNGTFATTVYEDFFLNSINGIDIEIETYKDFFWWWGFNFRWQAANFGPFGSPNDYDINQWQAFKNNFIPWFGFEEYQVWSIDHKHHFSDSIYDMKEEAKKYIFDLDKNYYYYKFKTKLLSRGLSSRNSLLAYENFGKLYDDGSYEPFLKQ